jgi:hypothetical protein
MQKRNDDQTHRLLNRAILLSALTVLYNFVEGVVSVYYGASDDALTLFGFGVDSFVETISGVGVWRMAVRLKREGVESSGEFERVALRVTGVAFYLLAAGLIVGVGVTLHQGGEPKTTTPALIISLVSLSFMWALVVAKRNVGAALGSKAILADANCSLTCVYLSAVLLVSAALFELTGVGYFDAAGSLGVAYFAVSEGRESFAKAKSENLSCGCKRS